MSLAAESLRIAGIVRESIVDGPGLRFVIFAQGCPHRCKGCHNESTHDFEGGYLCTLEKIISEIDKNPLLTGVTFSGGEPFCQPREFSLLGSEIKARGLDLIAYSGYTLEQLLEMKKENSFIDQLLHKIDSLVDGPFLLEERDLTLAFRGSKNQRMIDMSEIWQQRFE
ncbi:anaerobic ribonucleoside-triphosphate reductase activating protein [Sinanaerobacter chloroacetimidivorans]|jgi:anaerobic ribonucleoside-triphosphate reductase activating protein|uniref:Anaerobic ribonucleoside-triphosphate reductase-activating protein n=1 Tax=Sinanaerobacter chloroacetimidivorans TaxID=2818044 RepID=A0A8J7W029_9FIRM|nr:anaerobic ribonucleoside-triphosphate reductase activating protein [Sinanaerobacter chloroacetimidivorans]MBR0596525.1 anaerobic ribonucleoside-triphosphate reductase activating protein [Sinanaerobacter chloroacetimidivorans]